MTFDPQLVAFISEGLVLAMLAAAANVVFWRIVDAVKADRENAERARREADDHLQSQLDAVEKQIAAMRELLASQKPAEPKPAEPKPAEPDTAELDTTPVEGWEQPPHQVQTEIVERVAQQLSVPPNQIKVSREQPPAPETGVRMLGNLSVTELQRLAERLTAHFDALYSDGAGPFTENTVTQMSALAKTIEEVRAALFDQQDREAHLGVTMDALRAKVGEQPPADRSWVTFEDIGEVGVFAGLRERRRVRREEKLEVHPGLIHVCEVCRQEYTNTFYDRVNWRGRTVINVCSSGCAMVTGS